MADNVVAKGTAGANGAAGANEKRASLWNPFMPLDGRDIALRAARQGAWVAGYLMFVNGLRAYFLGAFDPAAAADPDQARGFLVIFGVLIAALALLAWRIWVRQPLWAIALVAALFALEAASGILAVIAGPAALFGWQMLLLIGFSIGAIFGLRGAFALRRMRRAPAAVS